MASCGGSHALTIKHLDMKKFKIILNAIVITVAIGGALATRYYMQLPDEELQYIQEKDTFTPVGDFGTDYNCYDSNNDNVCTFYLPDSLARPKEFLPSRKGHYVPIKK
jgi:hypothetical protein